jgi:thioredoxin-dependent peroxiredoxin
MRLTIRALCGALLFPVALSAQATLAPGTPKVGDAAPDFTLSSATSAGIGTKPVTLSSLKGRTVVIAFFPKARTSGCTIQMQAYRDKYDSLFHSGKDVTLFGVSSDSTKDLASWASDAKFQFTFLSDVNGDAGKKYGTWPASGSFERRYVFVVSPAGTISYVASFNPNDPTAYEALGKAINDAKGAK